MKTLAFTDKLPYWHWPESPNVWDRFAPSSNFFRPTGFSMSPLRWFRRHATWMLIIFGVVLMAIFGLGPVFDQMAQGFKNSGSSGEDPVIIKYRDGEITRSKLDELQRNHHASRQFLTALIEQSVNQCKQKEVQYAPMTNIVQPLARTDNQDVVDEQMLVRKLLADRAEDEGVVISDGMIDDYLSLIAGQAEFSPRDWKQINKLVNQRVPLTTIRKHLALELKSMQMQRYTSVGVPLNPVPTEAVELYAQANNRIECEVVPVAVGDYVSKVSGEPSSAEMNALFEEGMYEYEDQGMQAPGFKVPRKVNVQYFVAEMETFLQNEKNKLTDAQIAAEYEKLVEAEDPIVVEVIPQAEPAGFDFNFGDDGEKKADEKTGSMTDPAKTDAADNLDVKADVPVLKMPESTTDVPALPDADKLLNEIPAEVEGSGLKVTPAEEAAGGKDQSHLVRGTKSHFASFTQEEVETEAVEGVVTEAAEGVVTQGVEGVVTEGVEGAVTQGVEGAVTEAVEGAAQVVDDAPAPPTTAQAVEAAMNQVSGGNNEGDQEVGGLGDLQLSDESAGPMTGEDAKKTRIKPLSEVEEEIRTRLARAAAFKKKDEAKKRASIAMQTYQQSVIRWENSRDKDTTPKPGLPDFEAIAKDNGLVFRETGLVDRFELRDTEIGKVNFPVQVQSPQGPVRMDFQSVANKILLDFDRVNLLVPQDVSDIITANAYVFWMSEKEDVRIPNFDESTEKIKKYWKYQQAVDLAKQAAEKMAADAKAQGKKLTEIFPETAAPTGEFTWFRPGRSATAIFGMPFGIDNPGEEFMETAFSLKNGENGVAANSTRDTIYVIQRTSPAISLAELGDEYLDKQYFRFKRTPTDVMGAAQHYAQELEYDWREEFVKSMELKRMK